MFENSLTSSPASANIAPCFFTSRSDAVYFFVPTGSNSEAKSSIPPCNKCTVHLSNLAWLSSCLASLALRRLTLNLGMSIWQLQLSSLHVTTATHAWIVQGFYGTVACRVCLQKLSQNIYCTGKMPTQETRTQAETATGKILVIRLPQEQLKYIMT